MMTIEELLKKAQNLPTMISLSDELNIIADLIKVPVDETLRDFEKTSALLDVLHESHTGAAIFEVTPAEVPRLAEFGDWLRSTGKQTESDSQREYLEFLAEDFTATM